MEYTGTIIWASEVREGDSANGHWKMQDFVIEQEPTSSWETQNPKRMAFTVSDGRDGRLARFNIQVGKKMKVNYDIQASEYQGKWYNRVTAWDARDVVPATSGGTAGNGGAPAPQPAVAQPVQGDLPWE